MVGAFTLLTPRRVAFRHVSPAASECSESVPGQGGAALAAAERGPT